MGKSKKQKGTKETFEYVEEEFKFHVKPIKCKNVKQKEFLRTIDSHDVTIADGFCGSGKTYLAVYHALKRLEKNEIEKIVLVKSVVTLQGENLGYLPGNEEEKMQPFIYSLTGNIDKLVGEETRKFLMKKGKIVIQPLAFIRGINIDNAEVIIDEAQNLDFNIFKSIITRIGENSKYIITGDSSMQIDRYDKKSSILSKLTTLFENDSVVGVCTFGKEDCVRNPIITLILDKLETIE